MEVLDVSRDVSYCRKYHREELLSLQKMCHCGHFVVTKNDVLFLSNEILSLQQKLLHKICDHVFSWLLRNACHHSRMERKPVNICEYCQYCLRPLVYRKSLVCEGQALSYRPLLYFCHFQNFLMFSRKCTLIFPETSL